MIEIELNGVRLTESGYTYLFDSMNPVEITITAQGPPPPGALGLENSGYLLLEETPVGSTDPVQLNILPETLPAGFSSPSVFPDIVYPGTPVSILIYPENAVPGNFELFFNINNFIIHFVNQVEELTPVYTNYKILSELYGSINVDKWADLNNDRDPNEISKTVYRACWNSSRQIDSITKNGFYDPPFEFPYPPMIEQLASMQAAYYLYTTSGKFHDIFDKQFNSVHKEIKNLIAQINTGRIALQGQVKLANNVNAPQFGDSIYGSHPPYFKR